MSAVLCGWLRPGEVGSGEVTTTIHLRFSRVSRGADWLELHFPAGAAAAAERERERQRESTGRAGIAAINCSSFAATDSATVCDSNAFSRASRRITYTDANA